MPLAGWQVSIEDSEKAYEHAFKSMFKYKYAEQKVEHCSTPNKVANSPCFPSSVFNPSVAIMFHLFSLSPKGVIRDKLLRPSLHKRAPCSKSPLPPHHSPH